MKPPTGLRGLGMLGAGPLRAPSGLRIEVEHDDGEIVLRAFVDGALAGWLTMLDTDDRDWTRHACVRALIALRTRTRRALGLAMVIEVELRAVYQGRGVGLALYAKAAELAAAKGQALVPNSCVYEDEESRGHTSAMAQATWRRLAQLPGMLAEYHKGQVVAVYAGGTR